MTHRTLCGVLEEMRKCFKTRNFSSLLGLIEEAQSMGNRMEASLQTKKDYVYYQKQIKKLKKEIAKLEEKKEEKGGEPSNSSRYF